MDGWAPWCNGWDMFRGSSPADSYGVVERTAALLAGRKAGALKYFLPNSRRGMHSFGLFSRQSFSVHGTADLGAGGGLYLPQSFVLCVLNLGVQGPTGTQPPGRSAVSRHPGLLCIGRGVPEFNSAPASRTSLVVPVGDSSIHLRPEVSHTLCTSSLCPACSVHCLSTKTDTEQTPLEVPRATLGGLVDLRGEASELHLL